MCHKQVNKLEIAYKSVMRALDAKKKEFSQVIKEFYSDQRQKVAFDRKRASTFLNRVLSHQEEISGIERSLEDTYYEDLFRSLSTKSQNLQ
jgi:hypothetical protein